MAKLLAKVLHMSRIAPRLQVWLWGDAPIFILAAGYVVLMMVAASGTGLPVPSLRAYLLAPAIYGCIAVLILGPVLLWRILVDRPQNPIAHATRLASEWRLSDRLLAGLPALWAIAAFSTAFSVVKSGIPAVTTYAYDPLLVRLDLALHGGDPWRLIHPLVGYPVVTFVLAWIYQIWIAILFGSVLIVTAWIERPEIRAQFLVSYLLCWIVLGTIAAALLASVGPCFYEYFYGDRYFAPLMEYLRQVNVYLPIPALDVQQMLLTRFGSGQRGLGSGISAMPSLHVSMSTLFMITAWRASCRLGVAATVFLVAIFLGSIHLGYHYAVDGYASLIVTPGLWWLGGHIARKWQSIVGARPHLRPVAVG